MNERISGSMCVVRLCITSSREAPPPGRVENADDFADQESRRTRLQGIIDQVNQVIHEQSAATAAKYSQARRATLPVANGLKRRFSPGFTPAMPSSRPP